MNPRYREIHRAEIKRRTYKAADRRWDALYGAFAASIVLVGSGVKFCFIPQPGSCVIGIICFTLGVLFFAMYKWLLRILQNIGNTREWLKPVDHLIIAGIIGSDIALSNYSSAWLVVLAGVYGTWRLLHYSRPHWRTYYFRAGREYFREIESYSPNTAVKRDALKRAPYLGR